MEDIIMEKVIMFLRDVREDCEMALDERWDRSDSGFIAMRDTADDLLGLLGEE